MGQLMEDAIELNIKEILDKLVHSFKFVHQYVETMSIKFLKELNRHNYVTPTSYLELLNMYKIILQDNIISNQRAIDRFKGGLQKLQSANETVAEMEITLTDMQPELEKA